MSDIVKEVYAKLDIEWEKAVKEYEQATGAKFPCGPGCADCCKAANPQTPFMFPVMGKPEAEVLWETLKALPQDTKELLIVRERVNHVSTCILLFDDMCLAYKGRPFWCRIFGLSGMATCGKVSFVELETWGDTLREAHDKLRKNVAFVPIRTLIRGLARGQIYFK